MREVVVGFDVRVARGSPAPEWTADRREEFLLKPDVHRPLSVDEASWVRESHDPARELRVHTPRFERLEDATAARGSSQEVIALTTFVGHGQPDLVQGRCLVPAAVRPDWLRLGWDVADGFFPSGLSNCGYGSDVHEWRDRWQVYLNDHHLFDDLPAAFAFRDATDRRVPEHSPFAVLGIYLIMS